MRLLESARLALKDWSHDLAISVCSVLALACIITPLLLLHSVHQGVIKSLREKLLSDPAVLVIMPRGGSGSGFNEDFFKEVAAKKGVDFVIGRTRDVAAELQLMAGKDRFLTVSLEPTAEGDPIFKNSGLVLNEEKVGDQFPIYLTQTAANRLKVELGDLIEGRLSRKNLSGKPESTTIGFRLAGIVPNTVFAGNSAFLPLPMLLAIQDYRDDIEVPLLGIPGTQSQPKERFYESFRIYAKTLDDVETLDNWLNDRKILSVTKVKDIANLKKMDSALTNIVLIITTSVGVGFMAFMFSSVYASVQRKKRSLGMLRLLGLRRSDILIFSVIESLLTAFFGCLLSFSLYAFLSNVIDNFFSAHTEGKGICYIPPEHFMWILIGVVILALVSSLKPASKAANIDPSKVIREL